MTDQAASPPHPSHLSPTPQHGVAHVKQGGESNPKEAVAAANADKQAKKAEKESQQQGQAQVDSQDEEAQAQDKEDTKEE